MDDMSKTIRMAGDLIAENFDRFSEEIGNTAREEIGNTALFTNEEVTLQRSEKSGMATFHLKKQVMMEDFIDELTKYLAVEVLCAYCQNEGQDYKAIAYSKPYQEEMYVIVMESNQHGLMDEISVVFFESMDAMLEMLEKQLHQLKGKQVEVLEQQHETAFYKNFI